MINIEDDGPDEDTKNTETEHVEEERETIDGQAAWHEGRRRVLALTDDARLLDLALRHEGAVWLVAGDALWAAVRLERYLAVDVWLARRVAPLPASVWPPLLDAVLARTPLVALVRRVTEQWADADFVNGAPLDVARYVTSVLLALLPRVERRDAEALLALLVDGVQRRLNATLRSVRVDGMRVGESFSRLLDAENPLVFEELHDHERNERDAADGGDSVDLSDTLSAPPRSLSPLPEQISDPAAFIDDPDALAFGDDDEDDDDVGLDDLQAAGNYFDFLLYFKNFFGFNQINKKRIRRMFLMILMRSLLRTTWMNRATTTIATSK